MNNLQNILQNEELYNDLSSFLNEYSTSDLKKALQLYRDTHQSYICKSKRNILQINIYDIIYLEIQRHNITVYTTHGTYHKYGSLTKELKTLSAYGFIKCTQSCIVSVKQIYSIEDNTITLINGNKIHMSRKFASSVIITFSQNKSFKS